MNKNKLIEFNRTSHDNIAKFYEKRHPEIYNPIEQYRLKNILIYAISSIISNQDNNQSLKVLDYGAGTGNVTKHLLEMGLEVTAADVSSRSLAILNKEVGFKDNLETIVINGESLNVFTDNYFDFVVTYSVLHHVPDYLRIVQEFCRVVRPGGVILIDHEVCPQYWKPSQTYLKYAEATRKKRSFWDGIRQNPWKLISYYHWKRWFQARILHQRVPTEEGDIHVYPDDHIEWESIREVMNRSSELVQETDYLVCREVSDTPYYWNLYKDSCVDMRSLIMRKKYE